MIYDTLSEIYDQLAYDFDYDKWADYYIELLSRAGWRGGEILECACGTGSVSVRLARRCRGLICGDISEGMLRVARRKAAEHGVLPRFIKQDMRRIELPHRVSALICACDGVNYMTADSDLRAFLEGAKKALLPGGALAFDISAPYKFERVLSNGFFGEERDEVAYLWQNTWDVEKRRLTMDITFFVLADKGLYRRFNELHVQRSYTIAEIETALRDAGFSEIRCYGDLTGEKPREDELRIFFTAVNKES